MMDWNSMQTSYQPTVGKCSFCGTVPTWTSPAGPRCWACYRPVQTENKEPMSGAAKTPVTPKKKPKLASSVLKLADTNPLPASGSKRTVKDDAQDALLLLNLLLASE